MTRRVTRRDALLIGAAAALAATGCGDDDAPAPAGTTATTATRERPAPKPERLDVADLERRFDARLGIYALDTATGRTLVHRPNERFAFCSTHKALSAGALLRRHTLRELRATQLPIEAADLVYPSPICEQRVGTTMSLLELCDAAVRYSDNGAANHLLSELGGPPGFQRELRRLGDRVTTSDRDEPELSSAIPGDPRDTSTPQALAHDLRAYVLDPQVLSARNRAQLADWLRRNTTGDTLIRAAAPAGWVVGDKTGTGGFGTRNDIAVLWPPRDRPPIVLAVLSRRDHAGPDAERDDRLIAAAARRALSTLA